MNTLPATVPARRRRVSELRALVLSLDYAIDPELVAAALVTRVSACAPPAEDRLTPVGARSPAGRPRRPERC